MLNVERLWVMDIDTKIQSPYDPDGQRYMRPREHMGSVLSMVELENTKYNVVTETKAEQRHSHRTCLQCKMGFHHFSPIVACCC
jgi:hypothetical protein